MKIMVRSDLDRIRENVVSEAISSGEATDETEFVIGCTVHGTQECVLQYSNGILTYRCVSCGHDIVSARVAETHTLFMEPERAS